jgi:osmotically-inducible protein OsmY
MSNDAGLQQAVITALGWEAGVVAAHIGVAAKDGVVTLSGHVQSLAEKHGAEMAARRTRGVKAVVEEIDVRLPFDSKRGDPELASAAIDRLAWDAALPVDAVKVSVEKGWITLTGELDWNYQRHAAEDDLRRLAGVTGLTNQITIAPKASVAVVSDEIMRALHRSWLYDPKTVAVSVNGGAVRLTGTVRSWEEWQAAATAAWSAPGVISVENDVSID